MKILQINSVYGVGSTGRTMQEISEYCRERGNEVFNIYSHGEESENSFIISDEYEKKIHSFLSRLTGLQGYYSKKSTKKIIKYINECKPDIVRVANLHSNFINLNMLFNYLAINDIPTVITLDDCFYYTGKCCHYTVDNCYKWKQNCGGCPRLKKDNISWLFDRTYKMLNDKKNNYSLIPRLAVVGVSNWITNEAKESILSKAQIIQTIYNWIDLDKFKDYDSAQCKRNLGIEKNFILLGVATEWSNEKGLNDFIKLSSFLTEHDKIILVGKIPSNVILPSNIICIPHTNNIEELVTYYCAADVFLQLSPEETFGKVVAEALACGTPVVAYNSTANPELVNNGCGYVAEKHNLEELLDRIHVIKKNNKKYYQNECRNFAVKMFDKGNRIEDYVRLFNYLINLKEGNI